MLQTQIRIGQQLSLGRGDWDDILDAPKIETETKKGDPITNYVIPLIFDLDAHRVDFGSLYEYDPDESPGRYFNVKIQGGNNKAVYTCVEWKKLEQLRKAFFGIVDKKGAEPDRGQFTDAIETGFADLQGTPLYEVLTEIFKLRPEFERRLALLDNAKLANAEKEELAEEDRQFLKAVSLRPSERLVLVVAQVIWSEKGYTKPTLFSQIDGYQMFLKRKFIGQELTLSSGEATEKICYATGERSLEVGELDISARYSLNKMFVTTTVNYASGWENGAFQKNYQVDKQTQMYLERGSKYLLENYKTRIAGIDHCIIPQLLNRDESDIETTLRNLSRKSDLLFQFSTYQEIVGDIDTETTNPYWITFLGFESDGNFFKTINVIKDVSRTHFEQLITAFLKLNNEWKSMPGVNWTSIMSIGKEQILLDFNLFTVYTLIPVRKDKEKKNEALNLFKQVLEKRPVEREKLFSYFKELILCHYYGRYAGYTNIRENTEFDFAVRNAVFQYLAFIHILNQFNLINPMEENQTDDPEEITLDAAPEEQVLPEYQQKVEEFFVRMNYKPEHKALFYLGRVLNTVAQTQYKKEHKTKPVLKKLNYNGMDRDDIRRLHRDLVEKTQQYSIHRYTESTLSRFMMLFNHENWTMKPDEALFFILSGYSFFAGTKKKSTNNE
ncbi:TM1802 family CRISPR-associated protein [Spirosoma luteum]|uniref:TM1802 family CRISPR-associated protein n=1 Tax=Spirosoma luteum TaxID=431553 RepID=UPI000362A273|nr:TM1802 family CRISPR-associated protein [Spirosoma luteum]